MKSIKRSLALITLFALPQTAIAQASEVSGRWEGSIKWDANAEMPAGEAAVQVDLVRNAQGRLIGEISIPDHKLKSRPLAKLDLAGRDITFQIAPSAASDNVFKGSVSPDGATMSGTFAFRGSPLPFTLTRLGEARMSATPPSTPVAKDLEGEWTGVLEAPGKSLRLILRLSNQKDGVASASFVSLDQGNLEIPVAVVAQKGEELAFDARAVGGSFIASPSASRTELKGVWAQGALSVPLILRKSTTTK